MRSIGSVVRRREPARQIAMLQRLFLRVGCPGFLVFPWQTGGVNRCSPETI